MRCALDGWLSPPAAASGYLLLDGCAPAQPSGDQQHGSCCAHTAGRLGAAWPLPLQVWLENEHVRLMVLPQLGGRIHVLQVRLQSLACSWGV